MKTNTEFDSLIVEMIKLYTKKPKRKTLKKKEIEDFLVFVYGFTNKDTKYKQIQTNLMTYIKFFDDEIYTKIREAFSDIHNRGKRN